MKPTALIERTRELQSELLAFSPSYYRHMNERAREINQELAKLAPLLADALEAVLDAGMDAFLDEVITKDQQDRRCDTPGDAHARWEKVDGPLATKARAVKAALKKALEEE